MRASVVRLIGVRGHRGDWAKSDLAQLHRAADVLRHFGCHLETDGGMTDEGEPWFAFCDAASDDVVAHFARISGTYIVSAPFLKGSLRALALPDLIERFLDRYRAAIRPCPDDSVRPLYGRGR
jgi:hypothetical protein